MEGRSCHHSNSVTPILPQGAFGILCIKGFRFAYIYSCEQASVDYQKLKIRTYSHAPFTPCCIFPMIAQCASDNLDFEWTLRTENLTEISPSVQPSKYTVSYSFK